MSVPVLPGAGLVIGVALLLAYRVAPRYGRSNLLVYVLICSLIGSLTVVSCKVRAHPDAFAWPVPAPPTSSCRTGFARVGCAWGCAPRC